MFKKMNEISSGVNPNIF